MTAFKNSLVQLKGYGSKVWFVEIAPPHRTGRLMLARTHGLSGQLIQFKSADEAKAWMAEYKDWVNEAPKSAKPVTVAAPGAVDNSKEMAEMKRQIAELQKGGEPKGK